ncbi:hypothetical protein ACX0G9_02875 [Flavitalea flava]
MNSNGCFVGLRLTPKDSIPFAGDDLTIYANQINLSYEWSGPNNFSYHGYTGSNSVTIPEIKIKQSGWYYCTASVPGCNSYTDSVYIRVQFNQGTPSCNLNNNQITSTAGLPDFNAVSVTKSYSTSYSAILVSAYAGMGFPEYNFVFNSYYGNTEPKDGIYYTTDSPISDLQQDANLINMNCIYGPYYFSSYANGQKIYVSHVNGKLRIAFCSIEAGDGGGVHGLFTGELTEQ